VNDVKIAFLFPGQGSQSVGMGADLAANIPASLKVIEEASQQVGYKLDSLCFYGPAERLSQTDVTQPALFTVSVAALRALTEQGVTAEAAAGHSVGEYAALFAAGAIDFYAGLRLVSQRGLAMNRAALANPGAMAAVLGLEGSVVANICKEITSPDGEIVVPANFNGGGQVVISGTQSGVDAASVLLKTRGARKVIPLAVSGGFHSPLMKAAAEEMRGYLSSAVIANTNIPVVANVTADYESSTDEIKNNLAAQVDGSVRWEESMTRLLNDGFDFFIEIGSGTVLAGLLKRITKDVKVFSVFDAASVAAAVAVVKR
jgi:[acyl-carrier-protein] S-malonyltransferase